MRLLGLLLGSLCFASSAFAAQHANNDQGDHGAYTILLENDALVAPHSDKDYTMGLALRKSFRESDRDPLWHRTTLSLLKGLDGFLLGGDMTPTDAVWWELGSKDYTPRDLSNALPIYNDRPYASLLYLAAGYVRPLADGAEKRVSWQWGLLGTNIGREVQSVIHSTCCNGVHPNGWSHQIGKGGSPTFLFQEEWIHELAEARSNHDIGLKFRYGYSLGYYTRAILGTSLSYGLPPMEGSARRPACRCRQVRQFHRASRPGPATSWMPMPITSCCRAPGRGAAM